MINGLSRDLGEISSAMRVQLPGKGNDWTMQKYLFSINIPESIENEYKNKMNLKTLSYTSYKMSFFMD